MIIVTDAAACTVVMATHRVYLPDDYSLLADEDNAKATLLRQKCAFPGTQYFIQCQLTCRTRTDVNLGVKQMLDRETFSH